MNCKGKCIHADVCKRMLFPDLYNLTTPEECDRFKSKDDVVEIVRCKDCIYYENGKDYVPYCNNVMNLFSEMNPDGYCCHGERK